MQAWSCSDCPRHCDAQRDDAEGVGFCESGTTARVAKTMLHEWEEPCISGTRGSGAVFFSGCNLGCVYCQNHTISRGNTGEPRTPAQLRELYLSLIKRGAHNINLITAGHYARAVAESLEGGLPVPVVYNSGGYESVEMLRLLKGKVQVYLPDMKYMLGEPAQKYSAAPDYPEIAMAAIKEMFRQRGRPVFDDDGLLTSGVLIRHLILPGNLENTFAVIDWISDVFSPGDVLFSLMSQYTPVAETLHRELSRRITQAEYDAAIAYLEQSAIEDGFYQDLEAADEAYIPEF